MALGRIVGWIAIIGIAAIAIIEWTKPSRPPQPASSTTPPVAVTATPAPRRPTLDKSAGAQKKRHDLIQRLINERVFIKIDTPGNLPRVHVGPRFHGLDFDTKQQFISVVYAYHYDGSDEFALVRVFDGRTNKSIGVFSTAGLKFD